MELEVRFKVAWGSNQGLSPSAETEVAPFALNGVEQPSESIVIIGGHASPE